MGAGQDPTNGLPFYAGRAFDRLNDQFALGLVQTKFSYSDKHADLVIDLTFGPNAELGNFGNQRLSPSGQGYATGYFPSNPNQSILYGTSAAIKQANKQGKIKLIAFDGDPQQIVDLKRGVYDALVVQEPYQMGFQSVKLAGQLARGQIKPSQVKEEHLLPFYVVTRKNVNSPAVKPYFYKSSCS